MLILVLGFQQSFVHRSIVGGDQAFVAANQSLNGNRLWRRERQIVEGSRLALFTPISIRAVGAVTRAQEFTCFWMQPSPHRRKVFASHITAKPKQLCAAPLPLACTRR